MSAAKRTGSGSEATTGAQASPWVVVGLGNPGPRYELTRHNVGQLALDVLADRMGSSFRSHRANARVAEGRTNPGSPRLILAKSNGFMNTSGGPVAALLKYFHVEPANLIVVHDDLDLPSDTLKLKLGGGHGGHNGLRDIAAALGSPAFVRVRIGIGRPPGRADAADYVLKQYTKAESDALGVTLEEAADAVECVVERGLTAAQQEFHGRERQ